MSEYNFENSEIRRGGDWWTVTLMAEHLGRSANWVKPRIEEFMAWSEQRLDDNGTVRTHFHPNVVKALEEMSDREKILDTRDYVTDTDLAEWLHMETPDAVERALALGIPPIERRAHNGEMLNTYYPIISEIIKAQERKAIAHTLNAQNQVGSIQARIRSRQVIADELIAQGVAESDPDVLILKARMAYLQDELIDALANLTILEDEVDPLVHVRSSYNAR